MIGERWVAWDECCEMSVVRWVLWDEWRKMSGARWVWDEWWDTLTVWSHTDWLIILRLHWGKFAGKSHQLAFTMGNTNRFDIFSVRDIVLFRFRMVFGPIWNDLFLALAAASLGMVWLCSFNLLRLGVLFVCFVTLCYVVLRGEERRGEVMWCDVMWYDVT